jgi:hypothetical protein
MPINYLHRTQECRKAAERARDYATRHYLEDAARCWFTLANQAEIAAEFSPSKLRVMKAITSAGGSSRQVRKG